MLGDRFLLFSRQLYFLSSAGLAGSDLAVGNPSQQPQANQADVDGAMDEWWARKVAGLSRALGISAGEAESMMLDVAQDLKVNSSPGAALQQVMAVVADTRATVRVIGKADSARAVNVQRLPSPAIVDVGT